MKTNCRISKYPSEWKKKKKNVLEFVISWIIENLWWVCYQIYWKKNFLFIAKLSAFLLSDLLIVKYKRVLIHMDSGPTYSNLFINKIMKLGLLAILLEIKDSLFAFQDSKKKRKKWKGLKEKVKRKVWFGLKQVGHLTWVWRPTDVTIKLKAGIGPKKPNL